MIKTKPKNCNNQHTTSQLAPRPGILDIKIQDWPDQKVKVDVCVTDGKNERTDLAPHILITQRPMEHVFFECSPLNKPVKDSSGTLVFTDIYLHLYKDALTNMILPHYISFKPFNAMSFVSSLHRILFLNGKGLSDFHNGGDPWYQPRVPENIFMKGFIKVIDGQLFESFLQQKIRLEHLPGRFDYDLNLVKNKIRRKVKQLSISRKLNPANPDHISLKNRRNTTLLSIDELNEIICKTIDEHNRAFRFAQQGSPAQRFKSALSTEQMTPVPLSRQFRKVFCIIEERPLEQKGIEFKGICYSSPELDAQYQRHPGKLMTIEVEPWDLSHIRVHCDSSIIKAPARKSFYTNGLSLDQHDATLKMFRKKWEYEDTHGFVRIDQPLKRVLYDLKHAHMISDRKQ
jgi:hypothetical protein